MKLESEIRIISVSIALEFHMALGCRYCQLSLFATTYDFLNYKKTENLSKFVWLTLILGSVANNNFVADSDSPRRPERRRKKKPAPLPPQRDKPEDVLSGQFVRVNVHVDPLQHARLVVKSTVNESHPKKLSQNFNLSGLLRASTKPENATLNRPQRVPLYEKHHSWTNSVPRILKKSARSKSETRCSPQSLQPMPYRYIDATLDFPCQANQNNALFLSATGLKSKGDTLQRKQPPIDPIQHQPRLSFGYNVPGGISKHPMGNRVFGLTPKLKDFSRGETLNSKWGSVTDLTYLSGDRNNLKSSIKSGEPAGKKKNEKKVTFSAYTTVQVV